MLRSNRTAVLTMPAFPVTNPIGPVVQGNVSINMESYARLSFIDDTYYTQRIIVDNPNLEIATPTTVSLVDPDMAGRFTLISRNETPHNDLEYMIFYDSKYSDMFVIPTLVLYEKMSYITAAVIDVDAYGLTFTGDDSSTLPPPLPNTDVRSSLVNVAKYVNNRKRGGYYERMITTTYNYSSTAMFPGLFLNFGAPLTFFGVVDFPADINIISYNSLYDRNVTNFGTQLIKNTGFIVAELPM